MLSYCVIGAPETHEDVDDDNDNNNHDDIYSAVIMTRSLREFTRLIW